MFSLERSGDDGALPQNFAIFFVETNELTLLFVEQGGFEKNAIIPDDGRRKTFAGDLSFPADVFGKAPFDWDPLLFAGAVQAQATPGRPIFGEDRRDEQ